MVAVDRSTGTTAATVTTATATATATAGKRHRKKTTISQRVVRLQQAKTASSEWVRDIAKSYGVLDSAQCSARDNTPSQHVLGRVLLPSSSSSSSSLDSPILSTPLSCWSHQHTSSLTLPVRYGCSSCDTPLKVANISFNPILPLPYVLVCDDCHDRVP